VCPYPSSSMRGISPTVREGSQVYTDGALPYGRANAPGISNAILTQ